MGDSFSADRAGDRVYKSSKEIRGKEIQVLTMEGSKQTRGSRHLIKIARHGKKCTFSIEEDKSSRTQLLELFSHFKWQ